MVSYLACHDLISKEMLSVRTEEDVANISPPEECPYLHGLHFHRVSSTLHHHQPSNQTRVYVVDGPQNWCTIKRPMKRPPGGHYTAQRSMRTTHQYLIIYHGKRWQKSDVRLSKKNDTPYEGLEPVLFIGSPAANGGTTVVSRYSHAQSSHLVCVRCACSWHKVLTVSVTGVNTLR